MTERSGRIFNNRWVPKKKVSSGSFGVVVIGKLFYIYLNNINLLYLLA